MLVRETTQNRLLASLSGPDFALVRPALFKIDLPIRQVLQTRGRAIENVYFLESGLASVVLNAGPAHTIEVGIIGREGVTGQALIMGAPTSPNDTFIQTAGSGWRLSAKDLLDVMEESPSLRAHLVLFAHTVLVQMSYTALSDGRYKIDERLARWLLMAQDRGDSDIIVLTHEFLALMLGVRRPGVTAALNALETKGIISTRRGLITVRDRERLKGAANGSYGAPEAEFEKYFGSPG